MPFFIPYTAFPSNPVTMKYRIIIPRDLWTRANAELSVGQQQMAWGQVHRSYHDPFCDLLVRRLLFTRTLPRGDTHHPTFDWILIDSPLSASTISSNLRIEQSKVGIGQILAYLKVGLGENRDQWVGAVSHQGNLHPIDEITLVGPSMDTFARQLSGANAMRPIPSQWTRHVGGMGGEKSFQRFRRNSPLIIGLGRIGSLVAESFVRMGARKITLVDPDKIETHNLDATFGTHRANVGDYKAITVAKHLHRIRPQCIIHAITKTASDKSVIDQARRSSLIVTCVDNDEPRRIAAILSNQLLKIHLDIGTIVRATEGGIRKHDEATSREIAADIRLMLPRSCVACVGGLREQPIFENSSDQIPASQDSFHKHNDWQSGGRLGSLLTINEIAVGSALQLWIDFLNGSVRQSMWQRMRWETGRGLVVETGAVAGKPDCPICGTGLKLV